MILTDPFRMAAVLLYAQQFEAEVYVETRRTEALQSGDDIIVEWWGSVRSALAALRASDMRSSDDIIH